MPLAYALTDIDYISSNKLLSGIVENIIYESECAKRIPWKPLTNKALVYNRELTLPTASMMGRDGTWTSSSLTFTQVTRQLTIIGSQIDVDEFDQATHSDTNDPAAIAIEKASKAVAHLFDRKFVYGNDSSDTLEFDGLHALVSTSAPNMQVHCGATTTPAALTITKFFQFVDLIKPGKPDAIIMNKTVRRLLSLWAQGTTSSLFQSTIEKGLGYVVQAWDGIPILINEHITDEELLASSAFSAETGGSGTGAGGVSTSCFAVKFGESNSGLVGLDAKGGLAVKDVGLLENKDARRKRIVWYVGMALFGNYSLARIDGIAPASAVTI